MEDPAPSRALGLEWVLGFSYNLRRAVVDLSTAQRSGICFVAGHTVVMYNVKTHQQTVLQGHQHSITCLCASPDRDVVVSADAGPEALLVVWETATGEALLTLPQGESGGVVAVEFSPDGKQIATLSSPGPHGQVLTIWDFELQPPSMTPVIVARIPGSSPQTSLAFNNDNPCELLTTGRARVFFWLLSSEGGVPRARSHSPPLSVRDLKQTIGAFTGSVFVPGTSRAATATEDGDLVVWEERHTLGGGVAEDKGGSGHPRERSAAKILRIHHSAITALVAVDRFIVSGGADGYVRFYDSKFRLTAWFEELDAGEISSISFSLRRHRLRLGEEEREVFAPPDFVVATAHAHVVALQAAVFDEPPGSSKRQGELILKGSHEAIQSVAMHPSATHVAAIGYGGLLMVYDYKKKETVCERKFAGFKGTVVAYSPSGKGMACGFSNGTIKLITAEKLEDIQNFRFTAAAITEMVFSSDGLNLALSDAGMCIALLTYGHGKAGDKWEYVGKYRSHAGAITGLHFGMDPDGANRLLSVGQDGCLVEYDLAATSIAGGVRLRGSRTIGRAATPTAIVFAPPGATGDASILTSNDAYQLQLHDAESYNCSRTLRGPTFGGPVNKMILFQAEGKHYMVYGTGARVVGLLRFPLLADASRTMMGVVAHAGALSSLALSGDGRVLATAGGADSIVNLWTVDAAAFDALLDARAASQPPYEGILEGGPEGEFFNDLRDYFVCSQILSQGEDSTEKWRVGEEVQLEDLPNLMRALGYYPSNAEIADMTNEICQPHVEVGLPLPSSVSFPRFLAVFLNHQPLLPVHHDQIATALGRVVGKGPARAVLSRDELVRVLTEEGEAFSMTELDDCLCALMGPGRGIDSLPSKIDAQVFAEEILGFESYD